MSELPEEILTAARKPQSESESELKENKKENKAKNQFLKDYADRIQDGKLELPYSVNGVEYKYIITIISKEPVYVFNVTKINVSEEKLNSDTTVTHRTGMAFGFYNLYHHVQFSELGKVLALNATPEQKKEHRNEKLREAISIRLSNELKNIQDNYARMNPWDLYKALNLKTPSRELDDNNKEGLPLPVYFNIPADALHNRIKQEAEQLRDTIEGDSPERIDSRIRKALPTPGSSVSGKSEGLELSITNAGKDIYLHDVKWENDSWSHRICQKKFNEFFLSRPSNDYKRNLLEQVNKMDEYMNSKVLPAMVKMIKDLEIVSIDVFDSVLLHGFQKAFNNFPFAYGFSSGGLNLRIGINNETIIIGSEKNKIRIKPLDGSSFVSLAQKIIRSHNLYDTPLAKELGMTRS